MVADADGMLIKTLPSSLAGSGTTFHGFLVRPGYAAALLKIRVGDAASKDDSGS